MCVSGECVLCLCVVYDRVCGVCVVCVCVYVVSVWVGFPLQPDVTIMFYGL